jgi:hypothetical protein
MEELKMQRYLVHYSVVVLIIGGISAFLAACNGGTSSTITFDGREIALRGGTSQSVSTGNGQATLQVDGHTIVVTKEHVTVDGHTKPLAAFQKMVITIKASAVTLTADGRQVWP